MFQSQWSPCSGPLCAAHGRGWLPADTALVTVLQTDPGCFSINHFYLAFYFSFLTFKTLLFLLRMEGKEAGWCLFQLSSWQTVVCHLIIITGQEEFLCWNISS